MTRNFRFIYTFEDYYDIYDTLTKIINESSDENEKSMKDEKVIDFNDVNDAGFLKEFIWKMFKRPYWTEPKDLKLKEYQLWLNQYKKKSFLVRPTGVNILL